MFDCFFAVAPECPETKYLFKQRDVHPIMPVLMIVDKQVDPV